MRWPSYYPEDCPPGDSRDANETVYRCVSGSPPPAEDFVPYGQTGRPAPPGVDDCEWCGLSVYTEIEGIRSMWRRIPAFELRDIAEATLTPEDGAIKNTPHNEPSHHCWWVPDHVTPEALFSLI